MEKGKASQNFTGIRPDSHRHFLEVRYTLATGSSAHHNTDAPKNAWSLMTATLWDFWAWVLE